MRIKPKLGHSMVLLTLMLLTVLASSCAQRTYNVYVTQTGGGTPESCAAGNSSTITLRLDADITKPIDVTTDAEADVSVIP